MYGFLRTVFDKMGIRTNIDINTKDKFILDMAKNLGYYSNSRQYEIMYDGALSLLLNNSINRTYDVIVIDECQDFSDKEMSIINKLSSKIIAVGDFDQSVYQLNSASALRALPSKKLKTIYRFGKKIADLAEKFATSSESLKDKVSVSTNTDAYRVEASSKDDAFSKIARIINGKKHTNLSIAVLTLTRNQIKELEDGLKRQGVTTFAAQTNDSFRDYNFDNNTPILITPFSAKGMEFDVVILYGYNDSLNWSTFRQKKDMIIYVSLTRTTDELYLISQFDTYRPLKELSGWVEMSSDNNKSQRLVDGF